MSDLANVFNCATQFLVRCKVSSSKSSIFFVFIVNRTRPNLSKSWRATARISAHSRHKASSIVSYTNLRRCKMVSKDSNFAIITDFNIIGTVIRTNRYDPWSPGLQRAGLCMSHELTIFGGKCPNFSSFATILPNIMMYKTMRLHVHGDIAVLIVQGSQVQVGGVKLVEDPLMWLWKELKKFLVQACWQPPPPQQNNNALTYYN